MGFTKLFKQTLGLSEGSLSSARPARAEDHLWQAALHPDAHPDGGLACNDDQLLADMRSSILLWLKQMGTKLMRGSIPNLVNTSFPVNMFEPRSYLEKLSDVWVYPDILEAAVDAATPLERMKLLVTWFVAGLQHANEKWRKPFNPVLGETHQAELEGGVQLYMEQISHHPPLSAWLLEGPNGRWRYTGWSQPAVVPVMKWCGIKTAAKGVRRLELADGTVIEFHLPPYAIKGVVYQARPRAEIIGAARIVDSRNRLEAVLNFGAVKGSQHSIMSRTDAVSGEIYQLPQSAQVRFMDGVTQRTLSSLERLPHDADTSCNDLDSDSHSADSRADSFTSASSEAAASGSTTPSASESVGAPSHGGSRGPKDSSTNPLPYIDSASSLDGDRARDQDPKAPWMASSQPGASHLPAAPQAAHDSLHGELRGDRELQQVAAASAAGSVGVPRSGGIMRHSATMDASTSGHSRSAAGAEVPGVAVARIEGSWLSHLNIDNKRYWTLSQAQPTRFHPVQSPLPSDSRFRQDLKALAAGDAEVAQAAKEAMEHLQRRDRKLREEAGVHEGHGH